MTTVSLRPMGLIGGQEEYELFEVSGAARLADGSIVVYESGAFRVQKFGLDGEHMWSGGKVGEGPGDFQPFAELLVPCVSEQSVVIHDQYNKSLTVFDHASNPEEGPEPGGDAGAHRRLSGGAA